MNTTDDFAAKRVARTAAILAEIKQAEQTVAPTDRIARRALCVRLDELLKDLHGAQPPRSSK